VRAEAVELALALRRLEDPVDRLDDARRAAPRVVAGEAMAAERIDDEIGRRLEDARLGAAEAVEALLRVADDEEARRLLPARTAAGAGVRREPGMERMPLPFPKKSSGSMPKRSEKGLRLGRLLLTVRTVFVLICTVAGIAALAASEKSPGPAPLSPSKNFT